MGHLVDGLNPSRRKILAGSMKKFKQSNYYINEQKGTIQKHLPSLLQ